MKTEKLEELFDKHADIMNGVRVLFDTDFAQAIRQAELEWYKELDKKLERILEYQDIASDLFNYQEQIQNKIKELENEN